MAGGKKRRNITLKECLARPFCYYCERDFDDQKVLVDHQKSKHFHCQVNGCHRKLGTAGGLRVHMQQVHKEDLHEVPNAIAGREDPNIEVFAMIGIPESIVNAYQKAITDSYEAHAHKFRQETGNFLPGSIDPEEMPVNKKRRTEPTEEEKAAKKAEILRRKEEVLARKRAAAEGRPVCNAAAAAPAPPVAAKPVTPVPAQVYNTPPAVHPLPPRTFPPSSGTFAPAIVQPTMPHPTFGSYPPNFPPPMPPNMHPTLPPPTPYGHASPGPNVGPPVGLPFLPPPGVRGPPMPSGFVPPPGFGAPAHTGVASQGNLPGLKPPQASKSVTGNSLADDISQLIDEAQAKVKAASKESSRNSEQNSKAEHSASLPEKANAAGKKKAEKVSEKSFQPLADNMTSFEESRARTPKYATGRGELGI
ncbi:hypothetical protein AC578_1183 [Pseudocercospora eumusae]|uniref:C2H2-type domain-containing protein n=1 Tax=Pseudocercospora eumusae TaxID=321146 RepID=A0A139H0A6_9PEZI|nr:hypothetical protein AC578_1183 [Pseudocercospora eumusae]